MEKQTFVIGGKTCTLYAGAANDLPLVVLNNFEADGASVVEALEKLRCPDFHLLCVGGMNWDHDMSPWYAPPLSAEDKPCTGGADAYLELLLTEILPEAGRRVRGAAPYIGIAGYSLAGLFALYALYRCAVFSRAASMSGSLWFPGFREYCLSHDMQRKPDRLYLSLGDKEAKTRHSVLRTVQENTEALAEHYRSLGLPVTWELNPGNHFRDPALRSAKGILAILDETGPAEDLR